MFPTALHRAFEPVFQRVAEAGSCWRVESVGTWERDGTSYQMPRFTFQRPGDDVSLKLGIFAGVHGDEPAGVHALCDFVEVLANIPETARQYLIHLYPLCNPTGFEDGTRYARCGKDLNREFWRGSLEPEVQLLEREISTQNYNGLISLHSDDTSEGLYGFVRGHTLTEHLLKPALAAAESALPVNRADMIDGFHAVEGMIYTAYDGILSAPPDTKPAPVEIILETPAHSPMHLQRAAFVLALGEIIRHYRRLISFAADL